MSAPATAEQIVKRELKDITHQLSEWIGGSEYPLADRLKMRAGLSWFTRKMRQVHSSEGWLKLRELLEDVEHFAKKEPTKIPLPEMIKRASSDPDIKEFFEDVGVDPEEIDVEDVQKTLMGVWDSGIAPLFNRFTQVCSTIEYKLREEGY